MPIFTPATPPVVGSFELPPADIYLSGTYDELGLTYDEIDYGYSGFLNPFDTQDIPVVGAFTPETTLGGG
jgi:hypothetical protein